MNKEMNKLRWKYFIANKCQEIMTVLIIITLIFLGPYLLGYSVGDNYDIKCGVDLYNNEACSEVDLWIEGMFYLMGIFMGLLVLYFLGGLLVEWLGDNWRKAGKQAKEHLNSKYGENKK